MKKSRSSFGLIFVSVWVAGLVSGCVLPFGSQWKPYRIQEIRSSSEHRLLELSLAALHPTGGPFDFLSVGQSTQHEKFCWKLQRGAFLASCLVRCDGSESFLLNTTPSSEEIWNEAQAMYYEETSTPSQRTFAVTEPLEMRVHLKAGRAKPLTPGEDWTEKSKAYCSAHYDADSCILTTIKTILHDPTDILAQYERFLMILQNPTSTPLAILQKTQGIYGRFQEFMGLAARTPNLDTLQVYTLISKNIQNTPALLCQTQSLVQNLPGSWQVIESLLEQNEQELQKSIDFLKVLQKSVRGDKKR